MKRIAGLLLICLCVVACAIGLYISAANRDVVVYDFLFWPQVSLRSGLVVVLAFIVGALTGLCVAALAGLARRRVAQNAWPAPPLRRESR
ncbi:MAG: LapA family protein [Pseudomonadota bacterium]